MRDNTVGIIIVGLLGFLAIVVTGKWLLDKKEQCHHEPVQIIQSAPIPQQKKIAPPPVIVTPPTVIVLPPQYPHHAPRCHGNREFWMGYSDGYCARRSCGWTPEYNQGFQIGHYDRQLGKPWYYDRYWNEPNSGFSLKIPGFSLSIR